MIHMFEKALSRAADFTRPFCSCHADPDGNVTTVFCSCVFVNPDGWAVSAAHTFDAYRRLSGEKAKRKVENLIRTSSNKTGRPLGPSGHNETDDVTAQAFWMENPVFKVTDLHINRTADIAAFRVEGFTGCRSYPIFKDPKRISVGNSLCNIGYPFVDPPLEYDAGSKLFSRKNVPSVASFPSDGIISRFMPPTKRDPSLKVSFVETTAEGHPGQFGGPMIDTDALVAGIAVGSQRIPLEDAVDGAKRFPQCLMTTVGCDSSTVMGYLDSLKVEYRTEGSGVYY